MLVNEWVWLESQIKYAQGMTATSGALRTGLMNDAYNGYPNDRARESFIARNGGLTR